MQEGRRNGRKRRRREEGEGRVVEKRNRGIRDKKRMGREREEPDATERRRM